MSAHDHPWQAGAAHGAEPVRPHVGDELRLICRANSMMAEVVERVLHQDPRYREVWLRPAQYPGRIEVGGRVACPTLLGLLRYFADEWGGVELKVQVAGRDDTIDRASGALPC